jgi:hypothetical protein
MRLLSFFVHENGAAIPSLMFEIAADDDTLKTLALAALGADPNRVLVEVRDADRLLFCLHRNGVSWPGSKHQPQTLPGVVAAPKAGSQGDSRSLEPTRTAAGPGRARFDHAPVVVHPPPSAL